MIKFTFFTVLVLLGILQGLILIFFLARIKNKNRAANRFLLTFIALIVGTMIGRVLRDTKLFHALPNFLALPDAIIFLYGPILYFYFKKLFTDFVLKKSNFFLHAIPAVLFLISEIPLLFDKSDAIRVFWEKHTTIRFIVIEGGAILNNSIYLILSLLLLNKYKKTSNHNFSYKQYPSYLLTILVLIGFCLLAWLFSYASWVTGNYNLLSVYGYRFVWITLVFLTYSLAYFAMSQPELFKMQVSEKKEKNMVLEDVELKNLKIALEELMKKGKPFLQPKLSLRDLSSLLDVNTNILSNVINVGYGQNFNDFINGYRVNEFVKLVNEQKHKDLTILAMAFDAGFNSKTTFNTAFKKRMNQTPNQFLKNK